MGDGRPACNRVLTSGSVGMGIPMGIPVGMGWVWGLKCHPHGSPGGKGKVSPSLPYVTNTTLATLPCKTNTSVNVNLYNNAVLLSDAKFKQNMTKKVTKS